MGLIPKRLLGDSLGMVPKFSITGVTGVSQFKRRTSLAGPPTVSVLWSSSLAYQIGTEIFVGSMENRGGEPLTVW